MAHNSDFARVEEIFAQAIELPEQEQDLFLLSQAGVDSAVLAQVRLLLDARRRQGQFLHEPIVDFRGQLFGAYKATDEIGRGGMSIVYHGQRIDGDFDKRVAIKVLLANSTSTLRASEIQILASLNHPNIVQLLDAGSTSLGFRYLILEFIDGVRCLDFQKDAPERSRLNLFLQLCSAVQAAHQSFIIHRDLKPDNILITPEGTLKVLDFGIAKTLRTDGNQTTTTYAFTVDYASPEQIQGRPASTTDDVYSLGVLLHEWLSGQLPRKLSGLEMGDVIQRVSTEEITSTSLTGDLAAITLKALSRDPSRRYQTVADLARDIERYLSGDPVEARPPHRLYRARKLLVKHRYAALTTVSIFALLSFAAFFSWRQATLAERRFEQARAFAKVVMFDLHDAIFPLKDSLRARKLLVDQSLRYLDQLASESGQRRDLLTDAVNGYLRLSEIQGRDFEKPGLGNASEAMKKAELALDAANRLNQLASPTKAERLLQVRALLAVTSARSTAGQFDAAIQSADLTINRITALSEEFPADLNLLSSLASALLRAGDLLSFNPDISISNRYIDKAIDIHRRLVQAAPSENHRKVLLCRALDFRIANWFNKKNFDEALKLNDESLRIAAALYQSDPRQFRSTYAKQLGQMGSILCQLKRFDEGIPLLKQQLDMRRQMLADNPSDSVTAARVAATLDRIGFQLANAKSYKEATQWGEQAIDILRPLHTKDPANIEVSLEYLYALTDLSLSYRMANNIPRGCALVATAISLLDQHPQLNRMGKAPADKARKLSTQCSAPL